MRPSKGSPTREPLSTQSRSIGIIFAPILIFALAVLGVFIFTQTWHATGAKNAAGANDPAPPKPQGTQISNPPTTESWTLAKGLPSQVMRLAFSAADTTRGYAVAFVNKQTQTLYTSTDSGTTWQQVGTVQAPVGDFLSTDPLDPQDVAMLSMYAPTPGTYTFQRSLDGGHTWSAQTTDLSVPGVVSQIGWSDSTFVVGFELQDPLVGSSALVAFPKGQPSVHLDVNGKISGTAIAHLRLLTGHHNKITVWGIDGSAAQNSIGVATSDLGKSWASLSSTILGAKYMPTAATDDGGTIVAVSADKKRIAMSSDGGDTWASQPSFAGTQQPNQGVFVTAKSKAVVVTLGDGTYALHIGMWSRITSKQVVNVSDSGSQHAARLWSLDAQGRIIWLDA